MPKKILVIDDKHDIRALVCKFLNKKGFLAFRAKNAWQGIRLARRFTPDLILLDINMPLINGFTVLKHLKNNEKTMYVPIIMLTGRVDDESKDKAAGLYAQYYITKPFDLEELYAIIIKAIGTP
jgi:two-component system response regulator ResD